MCDAQIDRVKWHLYYAFLFPLTCETNKGQDKVEKWNLFLLVLFIHTSWLSQTPSIRFFDYIFIFSKLRHLCMVLLTLRVWFGTSLGSCKPFPVADTNNSNNHHHSPLLAVLLGSAFDRRAKYMYEGWAVEWWWWWKTLMCIDDVTGRCDTRIVA